ncbi:unnamed protein product [Gongylonema pulchrum]|uniref:TBP-binding domain-containing protein n=1 Tax=Gongylonema pulchrum TaxID=637853 RepID=A0A183CVE4_9BILA|nr:unnamed protein product [Gongylonema pulchrum]
MDHVDSNFIHNVDHMHCETYAGGAAGPLVDGVMFNQEDQPFSDTAKNNLELCETRVTSVASRVHYCKATQTGAKSSDESDYADLISSMFKEELYDYKATQSDADSSEESSSDDVITAIYNERACDKKALLTEADSSEELDYDDLAALAYSKKTHDRKAPQTGTDSSQEFNHSDMITGEETTFDKEAKEETKLPELCEDEKLQILSSSKFQKFCNDASLLIEREIVASQAILHVVNFW